jgi:sugar lactone lactonase YvrE
MLRLCHGNFLRLGFLHRYFPAPLATALTGVFSTGVLAIALATGLTATAAAATGAVTTTVLTVTAASGSAANITTGNTITLTAAVTSASGTIKAGQVNFCDASATYCTDIHVLATAQVTNAGTATIKLRTAPGSHSYKAEFLGTINWAASSSNTATVSVTGAFPSVTTIAQSGFAGDYSLTATVSGSAKSPAGPSGTISFTDLSANNSVLAKASLGDPVAETLAAGFTPAVGNEPSGIVAGDFNGDGNMDIAVGLNAVSPTDSPTILLGDGTGNFNPVTGNPITTVGRPVLVQDFNGDGRPDLLLADVLSASMTVLLGNGDGTFTVSPQGVFYTNYGNNPVAAGDFNGDGIPDLAVGGGYYLVILLGQGDGSFTQVPVATTNITEASNFFAIVTADLNGDGLSDLLIADGGPSQVPVYLSNGDGTFTKAPGTPVSLNSASSLTIGDYNGDGKLDLALALYGGSSQVAVFLGNGDGSFQATPNLTSSTIGTTPFLLTTGDFNGDGIADLFLGAQINGTTISVLQGKGDGTFSEISIGSAGLPCCSSATMADFNGDGATDIAAASFYDGTAQVLLAHQWQATTTVNSIAPAGPGSHQVVASFPGDANFQPSTSQSTTLQAKVADPVLTPASGTYMSSIQVRITEATPGATIYYESSSTQGFVPYTGPITLAAEGVAFVQAYALENGYQNSNYVNAEYNLQLPLTPAPAISLAAGYYPAAQKVTISDSNAAATIYYTTNGSVPNLTSNVYSGPVTVSSSETLTAIAIASGYSPSLATSAQYYISTAAVSLLYTAVGSGLAGYSGDGGPATLAQLDSPDWVARDSAGNLYLSDQSNHVVREVAAGTGTISTIAGTGKIGSSGDGGPATSAEFEVPGALAVDQNGNLFIADQGSGLVRLLNLKSGIISTYAGGGTGPAGTGDGGLATSAVLGPIGGITIDASRNVYISTNSSVRKVTDATGVITTIAGAAGSGYGGDGGPATSALLFDPAGLAFDAKGNLYIAESGNNVIREVNGATGIITTVAGTAVTGILTSNYTGDGGPATSAQLNQPTSVLFDAAGNLYFSDTGHGAIRKVDMTTGIISTLVGNGQQCGGLDGAVGTSASLCWPEGIANDNVGNLYIAEIAGERVREVLAAAAPPTTKAAAPTFSISGGTYASPQTVTISSNIPGASIYVSADGSTPVPFTSSGYSLQLNITGQVTLKAIAVAPGSLTSNVASATYSVTSSSPVITTVAGNGTSGLYGVGGPAPSAEFGLPVSIAVDAPGNVYVSDQNNKVVWKITASTGVASIYAGTGTAGNSGDGGAATAATLSTPQGLALDSAGNLYIADPVNQSVRKVTAATGIISTVVEPTSGNNGSPGSSAVFPTGVAVDSLGNLYVADNVNNKIWKLTAATGTFTAVAGNGAYDSTGDGGPATGAGLASPIGVVVDQSGNLFIATYAVVRKVAAATGIISTVAGVQDLPGSTGDGGPATSALLTPESVSLDSAGNLYVGSWGNEIREVNATTGIITRVAGIGLSGFSGDGGAAGAAELNSPYSVAFDATGNLYFTDTYNYRVRKVTFASQTTATPAFSVPAGTYATPQIVTITDTTPGAAIYYTTDGSAPSLASTAYTGPITVSSTETISAIAVAANYNDSAVAKAAYVIAPNSPTPMLGSLSPAFVAAGGAAFTLTVNGNGFAPASTVMWGTTALATQFVNASQLIAQVPAGDVAAAGTANVTVLTPPPGGGTSNTLEFEIDTAGGSTPPSLPTGSLTVPAGGTATYPVTLPASATNVSVKCLNLPVGAACSYSAESSSVVITTAANTPPATYEITLVFVETLPGAATGLLLLPILWAPLRLRKTRKSGHAWIVVSIGLLIVAVATAGGCGGGQSTQTTSPQTHQVTSSATVTLIVK